MSKRIAIIDLGTNTFHLVVAEFEKHQFTLLHRERQAVKIGMGGINEGIITDAAIERALQALTDFKQIISQYHPENILAFGTSALRNARNGMQVIDHFRDITGIECKIISGEQEAEYIYLGVKSAVNLGKEKSLIVDIGGGSVECIIANDSEIFWKHSFEIGAQRIIEKFQKNDPILETELAEIYLHFEQTLGPLFEMVKAHSPETLVGSSGTFDTLSDIYCIRSGMKQSDEPETPFNINVFPSIYGELKQKNRTERMLIPGMIEMRVDMIVAACTLIDFILSKHDFKSIRVSSYSLKEGVLASLIA